MGWAYREGQDTVSQLIEVCRANDLFFLFYAPIGTIRNKLGAHGQEPDPTLVPTQAHVDHMLHLVSANILFVARSPGVA